MDKKELGAMGEQYTANEYEKKGYRIVARNFRYKNRGEIDLVLEHVLPNEDGLLVFCEVKYRSNSDFAPPSLAVDWKKRQKIRNIAEIFVAQNPSYKKYHIRFDVAEVTGSEEKLCLNLLENAF